MFLSVQNHIDLDLPDFSMHECSEKMTKYVFRICQKTVPVEWSSGKCIRDEMFVSGRGECSVMLLEHFDVQVDTHV